MRVDIASNNRKFRQGDIVRVDEIMPQGMKHFPCDCLAIVDYYNNSGERLSLLLVHTSGNDTYLSRGAWYEEDQLKLVEDNLVIQGSIEVLLEQYHKLDRI